MGKHICIHLDVSRKEEVRSTERLLCAMLCVYVSLNNTVELLRLPRIQVRVICFLSFHKTYSSFLPTVLRKNSFSPELEL